MLTEIRKLNVVTLRLTSLVLLTVVIVTLLVACGGGDDGGGGGDDTPPDASPGGSGGDDMMMIDPLGTDLIISAISVSASSLTAGAAFTLNATVRNQGAEPAAATTLYYYRSSDATITRDDTSEGTASVALP